MSTTSKTTEAAEPTVEHERTQQALDYLIEEVRRICKTHGGDYMGIAPPPLEMACSYALRIARNAR
jgi:hypothetical protein